MGKILHTIQPQYESVRIPPETSSFRFFHSAVPAFEPYWHYHPELELTYIKKGQGVRFVGDHINNYHNGDLVLLGENLPHHWVTSKKPQKEPEVSYVFQFRKELFSQFPEFKELVKLFEDARTGLHYPSPKPSVYKKIESFEKYNSIKRVIVLLEILNMLKEDGNRYQLSDLSFLKKPVTKRHQSRVSNVTTHILEHLGETITLQQIAEKFCMTPPSFSRWFKKSTGKSYIGYLNSVRIEKACELLLMTDLPIIEIAMSTGFMSLSNFNRNFKRMKLMSPREYRKVV